MNRRAFFATLAAAILGPKLMARLCPPLPPDGLSIRILRQYDPVAGICRLDVLYGFGCLRPQYACRIVAEPYDPFAEVLAAHDELWAMELDDTA